MTRISEYFNRLQEWLHTPRAKRRLYLLAVIALLGWVLFRVVMIGAEHRLFVFNPTRDAAAHGTPVEVLTMKRTTGILKEPVTVRSNRALVSTARAHILRPGQKIGDGVIVSVSDGIDFDTGMHIVLTRGVADGLQYAEYSASGYFVPVYAIKDGAVMVADGDVARARPVTVTRSDADMAFISDGLRDDDVVILTTVTDGTKIRIQK